MIAAQDSNVSLISRQMSSDLKGQTVSNSYL